MTYNEEMMMKSHLVGYKNFVRTNPMTDRFEVHKFHHLELYCGDATNTAKRFGWGLGMTQVAKSDHSTGNHVYASYVMRSHDVVMVFTAPYAYQHPDNNTSSCPHPAFNKDLASSFVMEHGLAVRAIGVLVSDAAVAYEQCVANGGEGVLEPTELVDKATGKKLMMAEVKAYGDVILRWVSGDFDGPILPNYEETPGPEVTYGIQRMDHLVGNVPQLLPAVNYLMRMTGFHEYAEFVSSDVGTVDSGLNSIVLASNNEAVLLPINEPTFGTKRKSQIQTFLEQNMGPGLQHIALKTNNIFDTMRELKKRTYLGGFDFMPKASDDYYKNLPHKIGDVLTSEDYRQIEELGLLADKDDQGVLLQVFTRPVGDRPTLFLEIIQRVGCDRDDHGVKIEQKPGCGGFGKGNFSELFKSIEEYEKSLDV